MSWLASVSGGSTLNMFLLFLVMVLFDIIVLGIRE